MKLLLIVLFAVAFAVAAFALPAITEADQDGVEQNEFVLNRNSSRFFGWFDSDSDSSSSSCSSEEHVHHHYYQKPKPKTPPTAAVTTTPLPVTRQPGFVTRDPGSTTTRAGFVTTTRVPTTTKAGITTTTPVPTTTKAGITTTTPVPTTTKAGIITTTPEPTTTTPEPTTTTPEPTTTTTMSPGIPEDAIAIKTCGAGGPTPNWVRIVGCEPGTPCMIADGDTITVEGELPVSVGGVGLTTQVKAEWGTTSENLALSAAATNGCNAFQCPLLIGETKTFRTSFVVSTSEVPASPSLELTMKNLNGFEVMCFKTDVEIQVVEPIINSLKFRSCPGGGPLPNWVRIPGCVRDSPCVKTNGNPVTIRAELPITVGGVYLTTNVNVQWDNQNQNLVLPPGVLDGCQEFSKGCPLVIGTTDLITTAFNINTRESPISSTFEVKMTNRNGFDVICFLVDIDVV